MQHLRGAASTCLLIAAAVVLAPVSRAAAFAPDTSGVASLPVVRPPARLAYGAHGASMVASDGAVSFLGRAYLPDPPPTHALVADPAMPVIAYFQNLTDDPTLELQLQSQTDDDGEERYAFIQSRHGVPILGTFALAQLQDGMLHYARHFLIHAPSLDTIPEIAAARAQAQALRNAQGFAESAHAGQGAPSLAIFYVAEVPALVWVVPITTEQPFGAWDFYIDAHSGAMRGRHKTSLDAVTGAVTAQVEPACQGDVPAQVALPYVEWTRGLSTAADGSFATPQRVDQSSVRLSGPYFRIESYGENGYSFSTLLHASPAFNEVQLVAVPMSQVDPFYYASQVRGWLRQRLGEMPQLNASRALAWTNAQFPIRVNLPSGFQSFSCNAFYDGTALNFYAEDARLGCNNSARAAKIVYHEYGHGIHDHLTWSRNTFDPQLSEGASDYVAATITGDPNITGLLGCTKVLPGRTTVRTCVNHYTYCKGRRCNSHPGDECHNAAPILCGALWEMRQALGPEAADHFFLRFLTLATDMNSSYEAAIAADEDDDGDPSNGTTHSCEINRAFLGADGGIAHFPEAVRRAVPCSDRVLPAP